MAIRIEGRVAKLITDDELVINKGLVDGVEEGMRFWVMDEETQQIMDPETGEDLGGVPRAKTEVRVVNVGPRVSLAARTRTGGIASITDALSNAPRRSTLTGVTWIDGVRVGDPVLQITGQPEATSGGDR